MAKIRQGLSHAAEPVWIGSSDKAVGSISDGFHTFTELYQHRHLLFLTLMVEICRDYDCWKSRKHGDGSELEGWFLAGIELPTGQISYHLPLSFWGQCVGSERDRAPWDGHTANDVLHRLLSYLQTRTSNELLYP